MLQSKASQGEVKDCYCGLRQTKPEDLPEGYCGRCLHCGKPGHIRHFPGPVPYTGSWCDEHYRRLRWVHPLGDRGPALWLVVSLLAYLLWP